MHTTEHPDNLRFTIGGFEHHCSHIVINGVLVKAASVVALAETQRSLSGAGSDKTEQSAHPEPFGIETGNSDSYRSLLAVPDEGYPILDYQNGQEVEVGWRWHSGRIVKYQSLADVYEAQRSGAAVQRAAIQDRADAERYRFLRNDMDRAIDVWDKATQYQQDWTGDVLDRAIDAAMKGQP